MPLSHVRSWHVFSTPPLARHQRCTLRVSYRQQLRDGQFRYLIRTGSYWRGPIRELQIRVRLHGVDAATATVDNRQPTSSRPAIRSWSVFDVEPREDLVVTLR